jgi:hypothetical protein
MFIKYVTIVNDYHMCKVKKECMYINIKATAYVVH